jgi:hypothetical protein
MSSILKYKKYFVQLFLLILILNVIISIDMNLKYPLTINKLNLNGQRIYQRKENLFSLLNPYLIYIYLLSDWKMLINLPVHFEDCEDFNLNMLNGLNKKIILSNNFDQNQIPNEFLFQSKLKLENILLILLTSSKTKTRFDKARSTWINNLTNHQLINEKCIEKINENCFEYFHCCHNLSENTSSKLIIISDEIDYERGIFTLDELKGKSNYLDAQHRQLKLMKFLLKKNCLLNNINWIGLIDDDTWINIQQIIQILNFFNSNQSIILGHVLTDNLNENDLFYVSGGGGIFLSRSSFDQITPKLYSSCPFCKYNDITIGVCSSVLNLTRIHIPLFLAFKSNQLTLNMTSNLATIHYIHQYQFD